MNEILSLISQINIINLLVISTSSSSTCDQGFSSLHWLRAVSNALHGGSALCRIVKLLTAQPSRSDKTLAGAMQILQIYACFPRFSSRLRTLASPSYATILTYSVYSITLLSFQNC